MNVWAKHYQIGWEERAGDPRLPLWVRVFSLAYGKHRRNGHAPYPRGQVALVLSTVDTVTGEMFVPSRQSVHRAIGVAIAYGFLDDASSARCLVVPRHLIDGGLGAPGEPCPWHARDRLAS